MDSINPIQSRSGTKSPLSGIKPSKGDQKVHKIASEAITKSASFSLAVQEAKRQISEIRKMWDHWDTEVLAEKIIELEDGLEGINLNALGAKRVHGVAQRLHFAFVYPVVKELEKSRAKDVMPSFIQEIGRIAKEVLESNSIEPFLSLNAVQKNEVLHFLKRGE